MIADKRTRQRLASATRFGDIRELEVVDSTNRYLFDLARAGAPEGVVVVADHQSAGRGRYGRQWESRPGQALLASILLRPRELAVDRRHLVTAAVALAAADACWTAAGVRPAIKWPNDLLVEDRKLAGIRADADGDAIVVGIGLNVGWAPPGAVCLHTAAPGARGELLAQLLEGLEGWCDHWDEVATAYSRRCATVGRLVRADLGDRSLVGVAEAVDEQGRLRVAVAGGGEVVEIAAGDVVHVWSGEI